MLYIMISKKNGDQTLKVKHALVNGEIVRLQKIFESFLNDQYTDKQFDLLSETDISDIIEKRKVESSKS